MDNKRPDSIFFMVQFRPKNRKKAGKHAQRPKNRKNMTNPDPVIRLQDGKHRYIGLIVMNILVQSGK